MSNSHQTLRDFGLRQTDCRQQVLDLFTGKTFALAHADVENAISDSFDRVTIYRTLKTFLEKGLIHKVLDDEGGTKYALCKSSCHEPSHLHHHDHVHFKCTLCGHTNCLDEVKIPAFQLPEGYQRAEVNMLVQGVCPSCQ
jgi:Fur family transcriptional regulator, ferric uptake regulator